MRAHLIASAAALLFVASACHSSADNVCQDIGDCLQRGDNDWIASCQAEANALGAEARRVGCGAVFDSYYGCADSNYACHGATAVFPGCDADLAALDACLAAATSGTACARLTQAEAACAPSSADAGVDGGVPPACTAARDCQAQCYLANVANACAPQVDEIEATTACAATCVP